MPFGGSEFDTPSVKRTIELLLSFIIVSNNSNDFFNPS